MPPMAAFSSPFRLYRQRETIPRGANMKSNENGLSMARSEVLAKMGNIMIGARAACLLTACIAIVSAQAGTITFPTV